MGNLTAIGSEICVRVRKRAPYTSVKIRLATIPKPDTVRPRRSETADQTSSEPDFAIGRVRVEVNGKASVTTFKVRRNQARAWLFLLAFSFMVIGRTAHAVTLNLGDGNSSVSIDLSSERGLYDWIVDGVNLAPAAGGGVLDYRQWFWYRLDNNPEASIDTMTLGVNGTTDANFDGSVDTAFVSYSGAPGFKINVTFTLAGGTLGSGASDIGEQVSLVNTSSQMITVSFFQFGDFQLTAPDIGGETISFVNSNTVRETGLTGYVQETVHTPVATHQEAELFPVTIFKLDDASPTTLSDNASAGPGDVTWAYQWDVTLAPGQTFLISKDMQAVIPEPSTALLVLVALLGLLLAICSR
jgi:hypothetical protein